MKPCSPTPSSPIRSPRVLNASVTGGFRLAALLLIGAVGGSPRVWAHGGMETALPHTPGWQVDAGVAWSAMRSAEAWPVPRLDGVLQTGQTATDQQGRLVLEQARVGLGARLTPWLGAQWTVSAHDRDAPRTDTAWLEARTTVADGALSLRLGRQEVPLGGVIAGAGQFDRFGQAPLAKQATLLDGSWADDGVTLHWQQPVEQGLQSVALGWWKARAFPGGPSGPGAPSAQATFGWDHLSAQVFGAWLQPRDRGAAAVSSASTGHSHGVPDCTADLQNRVCFEGRAHVFGAALSHDGLFDERLSLTLAGMTRHESGTLYSDTATAQWDGRVSGVWLDAVWRAGSHWQWAARWERLVPRHTLTGSNPGTLASAAGLSGAAPVRRLSGALGYTWEEPGLSLWVETGRQQGPTSDAQSWWGVRLLWQPSRVLSGVF